MGVFRCKTPCQILCNLKLLERLHEVSGVCVRVYIVQLLAYGFPLLSICATFIRMINEMILDVKLPMEAAYNPIYKYIRLYWGTREKESEGERVIAILYFRKVSRN